MDETDPIDVFIRLVGALRDLTSGDPVFGQRVRLQANLYREMAVTEPASLRREIDRLHAQPGLSPHFPRAVLETALRVPPPSALDFSFYPPAQEFFHFLARGGTTLSQATVHHMLDGALHFDMAVLRAGLIEAMRPTESTGFEQRGRVLSEMLRRLGEDWYKPILKCALAVSFRSRGMHDAIVPQELGAVMAGCRDSHHVPATILRDELRIIRNAVAHSHLEFDLDAQLLTFVNEGRNGRRETLGPLSWEELRGLSDALLDHCWALALVCKRQRRPMAGAA